MVHGQTGLKDKLTHAGIYGLDTSRKTVEDLFNIKIDYSIKIGFKSVVELVDLVGGVDIDSDTEFDSYHMKGWHVKKGINHMDGKKALAYARERYAYRTGDRHRIQNQEQVLEAVLKKLSKSKTLLTKYEKILDSISKFYKTTIPKEYITLLIKDQLTDMEEWEIENMTVSGSDLVTNTHTSPKLKRYVMVPYEKDVKKVTERINEILDEER
jgi:LCP family protein required for cell wall assembly